MDLSMRTAQSTGRSGWLSCDVCRRPGGANDGLDYLPESALTKRRLRHGRVPIGLLVGSVGLPLPGLQALSDWAILRESSDEETRALGPHI